MPELDHVRGLESRPDLPGPPNAPTPRTLTDEDVLWPLPKGDPDATSKDYFIETTSPHLHDVEKRTAEHFPNEEDD